MKEKIKIYRKYIEQGVFILIVVGLIFVMGTLFKNGGYLAAQIIQGIKTFLDVIAPMIYAFGLAYVLYKPMRFTQRYINKGIEKLGLLKKEETKQLVSRLVSIFIVFAIVAGSLVLLIQFLVPPIIENLESLLKQHSQIEVTVREGIYQLQEFLGNIKGNIDILLNPNERVTSMVVMATDLLGQIGTLFIDMVATIILTFYFLKDKERLFESLDRFANLIFSRKVKQYVQVVIKDIDEIIGGFIVGTILAGIIVGVISTTLMLIIGHPFAVLIGTVAGITNMIPYVGPVVGAILALVLGLLDSVQLGVIGCILLLLYQQVDGNFIEPKVVGDKIGLAPVWILIAVIIGGSYYGGIGMILSAPIAALIKVYIDRACKYKAIRQANKIQ